jgi:hypothetical protein
MKRELGRALLNDTGCGPIATGTLTMRRPMFSMSTLMGFTCGLASSFAGAAFCASSFCASSAGF